MQSRRLLVLYGSETGTAEEVAERVGREARRRYFTATVAPMNDISVEQLTGSHLVQSLMSGNSSEDHQILALFKILSDEMKDKGANVEKSPGSDDFSDEFLKAFYLHIAPLAVVFVASTTGQGDDPENMKDFFKTLWAHRQNKTLLHGLKYGVIALGDSSYQKFNYSGKRLNNLLSLLGANTIVKIGLADDQHDLGPDFVVDEWLPEFWQKLSDLYPLPDGVTPIGDHVLPLPRYTVRFVDEIASDSSKSIPSTPYCYDPNLSASFANPCPSSITKLERVTASDHFQDVRLIEFDVGEIKDSHKPGDVLMVQPENLDKHVEEFLNVLKLDGSRKIFIEPNDSKPIHAWLLPQPCSVYDCVKKYLDIMAVPKRYFFELLSFFTSNQEEKEKFLEFASAKGQQDLYDYCNRPMRSIVEILADFPFTNPNIPFEYLLDLIPAIKPRAYSIASSSLMYPGKAQILVAVVNYRTILRRPRLGLCSNWLITLSAGDKVHAWIKKGTLTFPSIEAPPLPPVIMIGPGTGCAPFRSYIQERIASQSVSPQSPMLLFFGCRSCHKDHFFEQEWNSQCAQNKLELYTAFSRDQEEKIYVQHRIREHAARLWSLISDERTQVYFAGNAKRVPIDVHDALTYVCQVGLGDDQQSELYMKKNLGKRYQTETWA